MVGAGEEDGKALGATLEVGRAVVVGILDGSGVVGILLGGSDCTSLVGRMVMPGKGAPDGASDRERVGMRVGARVDPVVGACDGVDVPGGLVSPRVGRDEGKSVWGVVVGVAGPGVGTSVATT